MRPLALLTLLALALPAAAQAPALSALDACLGRTPADDLAAVQTCYYEAAQVFLPNEGEYVEPAQQSPATARRRLDACLAERSALEADLQQMCFYDAGNALLPHGHEGHGDDMADVGPMPPSAAVEIAFSECLEAQVETGGAARCYADAIEGFQRITGDLGEELAGFMTPAEAEAFREADAAWADYVQRESRYLDAASSPERFADPGAAEAAVLERDERMLNLLRNRYYWLDSFPRG